MTYNWETSDSDPVSLWHSILREMSVFLIHNAQYGKGSATLVKRKERYGPQNVTVLKERCLSLRISFRPTAVPPPGYICLIPSNKSARNSLRLTSFLSKWHYCRCYQKIPRVATPHHLYEGIQCGKRDEVLCLRKEILYRLITVVDVLPE